MGVVMENEECGPAKCGNRINWKSGSDKKFMGTAENGSTAVRNIKKSMNEPSASTVHGMPLFSSAKK